jgi:hypothetical protein
MPATRTITPFEVRRIKLTEMPMVQGRRVERDRYVATFVQALESSAVRSGLDLPDANRALDSETGQVTILRGGWFHDLTDAQVAADVAEQMLPWLDQVDGTDPRASVVDDVQVMVSETLMAGTFTVQELVVESAPVADANRKGCTAIASRPRFNTATPRCM